MGLRGLESRCDALDPLASHRLRGGKALELGNGGGEGLRDVMRGTNTGVKFLQVPDREQHIITQMRSTEPGTAQGIDQLVEAGVNSRNHCNPLCCLDGNW